MSSSDDDFNKLDTLSDEQYLKLVEKFYDTVRGKIAFDIICISLIRMPIISHFRILISIRNNDWLRNYLHVYDHLIPIPSISA